MLTDSVGGYDPNSAWPTVNVMTLLADPRGGVLIGGDFYGRLTLGTTVLSSMREGPAGASWGWYSSDLLVARYGSAGWSWVTTVGGPKEKGFAGMGLMPTGQLLVGGRALAVDSLDFGTNIQRPNSWSFVATLGDRTPLGGATPTKPATLALWPNPAGTTAHLTLPATAGATTEVVLLDALGRVVRTQHLAPGTSTLDLRGLPAGLYLVRAGALTTRLIVRGAE
jgi:hypothetical protein